MQLTALQLTAIADIARLAGEVGPAYAPIKGATFIALGSQGRSLGHGRRAGQVSMYRATYRSLLRHGLIEVAQEGPLAVRLTEEGRKATS